MDSKPNLFDQDGNLTEFAVQMFRDAVADGISFELEHVLCT